MSMPVSSSTSRAMLQCDIDKAVAKVQGLERARREIDLAGIGGMGAHADRNQRTVARHQLGMREGMLRARRAFVRQWSSVA